MEGSQNMARRSRQRTSVRLEDLQGKTVRAYVRESTLEQTGSDHYGPDLQREGIARYCKAHGLNAPSYEYFEAVSGRSTKGRTQLQAAMDDSADYDVLIFFHSSRSFRNRRDALNWKHDFRAAGIVMVYAEQNIVVGNPGTKLQEGFHELIDEQRSDELSMFVEAGLRQKFLRGLVNGTVPLGYARFRGDPGDPANGKLVVVGSERDTVRAIFDLMLTGCYSFADACIQLNAETDAEGLPLHRSKRGRLFTPSALRDVVHNRIYLGLTVWHPGTVEEEVGEGAHEPIVTQEEFDRVQQICRERASRPGRVPTRGRVYPFSGPAHCAYCGRTYVGDAGGKYGYLRMRHAFGECEAPLTIAHTKLDAQMAELLAGFALPKTWKQDVLKITTSARTATDPALEKRRLELQRAKARHVEAYPWSDMSAEDFRAEQRRFERALVEVSRAMPSPEPTKMTDVTRVAELLDDLGALWAHPGVSAQAKKHFIEEAFDEILLDELGICSVTPTESFSPLVALAVVGGFGAGDRIRTGDPLLGKQMLCQLSYSRAP